MKYKKIELLDKSQLTKQDLITIKEINDTFSEKDLRIVSKDNKVFLYLRELNLKKLKNNIPITPFLTNLIKIIEKIGSYGLKNGKRVYVDYDIEKKVKNVKQKTKKRGVHYYTKGHTFPTTNNSCPEQYINQIICDDCRNTLKNLPDNCIDLVFTSPPYNFGMDYSEVNDDTLYWNNYFNFLYSVFDELIRVVKYGGRIIVNVQPSFLDYVPTHHIISNFFMDRKMIWRGEILWEKNNYNCKCTAWGSWKSPSSPYLKYTWEFLEVFCKGTIKHSGDKSNIDITDEEFKKFVVAKWSIAPERRMKEFNHPAMFPEKLVEQALKLFSYQNDIILDPFNGVGTTTYVCKNLNRKYIGIDISEQYCKIAIDRLN